MRRTVLGLGLLVGLVGCVPPGADSNPQITVPPDMAVDATGARGATVTYSVTGSDSEDGPLTPTCAPASGGLFGVGRTRVTCRVTDKNGGTAEGGFDVVVRLAAFDVTVGQHHTCAIVAGGEVMCWGDGGAGQIGRIGEVDLTVEPTEFPAAESNVPLPVEGVAGATSIAAGGSHTCAIVAGGSVLCWGDGTFGQLGNGALESSAVPVAVQGVAGATSIAAGESHNCALVSTGVTCWGETTFGQRGPGLDESSLPASIVSGVEGANALYAGGLRTCVLSEGAAACWGTPDTPDGAFFGTPGVETPALVAGTEDSERLSVGSAHACLLRNETIACWGDNAFGQLGGGPAELSSITPVPVRGIG